MAGANIIARQKVEEGIATQYSCLENHMNRGARWATVHRVTESDTTEQLSTAQQERQEKKEENTNVI